MMDAKTYKKLLARVQPMTGDYAAGYRYGLARAHYGDAAIRDSEHLGYCRLGGEIGRGYQDGCAGVQPTPKLGRPEIPDDEREKVRSLRLSKFHWHRFLEKGGKKWLIQQLEME